MQGDTLAPFLFVIVLDYAMRRAIQGKEEELGFTIHPRRGRRAGAKSICDLDFADDIVLLSNEIEQARKLLRNIELECFSTPVSSLYIASMEQKSNKRLQKPETKIFYIWVAGAHRTGILEHKKL